MSTSFLYKPQNNTQTDTIGKQDTTASKTSLHQNFNQTGLSNKSNEHVKSELVKKIDDGFDATSYIYSLSGKPVPLADNFINSDYFVENKQIKQTITLETKQETLNLNNEGLKFRENDYLLFILILLSVIIGFIKINGKSYLQRTISSVRSFAYSHMLYNERNKLFQLNDLLLLFVFHLSFGIFLFSLFNYYGIFLNTNSKVLIYMGFIGINYALIFGYKVFIQLIGKFVSTGKAVSEYIFYVNNLLIFLGILNVFFLFGILFAPQNSVKLLIFVLLFTYAIAYIARGFKIISVFLANRFSLFYMILYFCALEIIPILIFGNYVMKVYNEKLDLLQLIF